MKKGKKIIIILIILLIIAGIVFFVIRKNSGSASSTTTIENLQERQTGIIKYENKIEGLTIENTDITKEGDENYIVVGITNDTEIDRYSISIGIDFVNSDGDCIFKTGCIEKFLPANASDIIYAKITPEIAKEIENLDHIEMYKLD